jgi:hypothetical protein
MLPAVAILLILLCIVCCGLDDYDDICFSTLDLKGDKNLWGTYIKRPSDAFVDYCKEHRLFSSGAHSRFTDPFVHEVTPKRRAAQDSAADNMGKATRNVIKRVKSKNTGIIDYWKRRCSPNSTCTARSWEVGSPSPDWGCGECK